MVNPKLVEQAIEKIKQRGVNYQYFFDHLNIPDWIQPLKEKGFFANPPEPIEEGGYISFPTWPESRYLVRVAKLAPEKVLQAALDIPDTKNARVQEDLIDAALAMPADYAAKLTSRVYKWAQIPYLSLALKVATLISYLAREGQIEPALDLSKELLKVVPPPGTGQNQDQFDSHLSTPRSRIDLWEYEQFLENNLPDLITASPQKTFDMLIDLLEEALESSVSLEDHHFSEYSELWRPAIEPNAQNSHTDDVRNLLVSAIRAVSVKILEQSPEKLSELINKLEAKRWVVFKRLALSILLTFGDSNLAIVSERLTNEKLFYGTPYYHEYMLLGQAFFHQLEPKDQEKILSWIETGPDLTNYKKRVEIVEGKPPSEDDLKNFIEHWQLRRLAVWKDSLPKHWLERYAALVSKYAEPEHSDFLSWSSGVQWGPTSPLGTDDIESMSVSDLVEFLRNWKAPSGFTMESSEGVSRVLTKALGNDPTKYSSKVSLLIGLEPTYIRGIFAGFREAAKAGTQLDWRPILSLAKWVVAQPRDIDDLASENIEDRDPHWGWTRTQVAWLLADALESQAEAIQPEFEGDIWDILKVVIEDPEPTPEHEEKYGGSNMDPATLSINTTRGVALHALIAYISWKKAIFDDKESPDSKRFSLDILPEVKEALESHLVIDKDPSLAIRSVYGWRFGSLLHVDADWTIVQKGTVFPSGASKDEYRRAAWDAFLRFSRPNTKFLEVLGEEYQIALERHRPTKEQQSVIAGEPSERLTEHLITYYWWGLLSLKSPLYKRFWSNTDKHLHAHAIEYIGRSLVKTSGNIPPEIIKRLVLLWEERLKVVKEKGTPEYYSEELKSFGWWFASGAFDTDWSIRQLLEVLKLYGEVEADHLVVERLASIAIQHPLQVIFLLKALIEGDRKGWNLHHWRENIRTILTTVLEAQDMEANRTAKDLINYLGARGYLEYRDLVKAG